MLEENGAKSEILAGLYQDCGEYKKILAKEREALEKGDWDELEKWVGQAENLRMGIEKNKNALNFSDLSFQEMEGIRLIMEACIEENQRMIGLLHRSIKEVRKEMAELFQKKSFLRTYAQQSFPTNRIIERKG